MDLKALKRLLTLLRAQGVVSYTDGPISLVLGDKPQRASRVGPGPSLEDDVDPRFLHERPIQDVIREANHRPRGRE